MNKPLKLLLLLAVVPFALTSCEEFKEKQSYCLETSDTFEYKEGLCYQVSRKDILESVFVIAPPTNPDKAENEKYTYPITWKDEIHTEYFSFVRGLEGKKVISILKLGDNVLKVNIEGAINKEKPSYYGFIKIHFRAFKSYTPETKEAYLYAFVTVGPSSDVVRKPANVEDYE